MAKVRKLELCLQRIDSNNSHRLPSRLSCCTRMTLHYVMGVTAPMTREMARATNGIPLQSRILKTRPLVYNPLDYRLIHRSRGSQRQDYASKTNDNDENYNKNKTNLRGGLLIKVTLSHRHGRRARVITATICAPVA